MNDEQRKYTDNHIKASNESRARQQENLSEWSALYSVEGTRHSLIIEGIATTALIQKMIDEVRKRYDKCFLLEPGSPGVERAALIIRRLGSRKHALESLRA